MLKLHNNYGYDPEHLILVDKCFEVDKYYEILRQIEFKEKKQNNNLLNNYNYECVGKCIGTLNEINICLTYNCNFRCIYCDASSTEGEIETLSIDDVKSFINDSVKRWKLGQLLNSKKQYLKITFSGGGEPTYNWNLFSETVFYIISCCKKNKIHFRLGITSNGALDISKLDFLVKHFDDIMISYDGLPCLQNKYRKSPYYDNTNNIVTNSILYLINNNKNVTIRTTISQMDLSYLKEMADYIFGNISKKITWSIRPVISAGRAINTIKFTHKKLEKSNFFYDYLSLIDYVNIKYPESKITTPFFPNNINDYACGEISLFCDSPCLMPDGRILTCLESKSICTEIGKVSNGQLCYFESFKDPLLKKCQEQSEKCKECLAYRFCRGGCPVRNIIADSCGASERDWECSMIITYFDYIFSQLINGENPFGWSTIPVSINGQTLPHIYFITKTEV